MAAGWNGDTINRAAFQIGQVKATFGKPASETRAMDLKPYFDPAKGEIRSSTGELVWNYKSEVCTMDAPKAQGVTGFLKRNGGRFNLTDVRIQSDNDYATINGGKDVTTEERLAHLDKQEETLFALDAFHEG